MQITPPSEIIITGEYGYNEKYKLGTRLEVRAEVSGGIGDRIRDLCRRIIEEIGIYSMSRIDFFLSGDRIFLNEINTMPGFTKDSLYPRMLEESGIAHEMLIDELVRAALERSR